MVDHDDQRADEQRQEAPEDQQVGPAGEGVALPQRGVGADGAHGGAHRKRSGHRETAGSAIFRFNRGHRQTGAGSGAVKRPKIRGDGRPTPGCSHRRSLSYAGRGFGRGRDGVHSGRHGDSFHLIRSCLLRLNASSV